MALTDLPVIKTPENVAFLIALSVAGFIFFFTEPKTADLCRDVRTTESYKR